MRWNFYLNYTKQIKCSPPNLPELFLGSPLNYVGVYAAYAAYLPTQTFNSTTDTLTIDDINALADAIPSIPTLASITIKNCNLDDEMIMVCANSLCTSLPITVNSPCFRS